MIGAVQGDNHYAIAFPNGEGSETGDHELQFLAQEVIVAGQPVPGIRLGDVSRAYADVLERKHTTGVRGYTVRQEATPFLQHTESGRTG